MEYTLVEENGQLAAALREIEAAELLGMDTEFVAEDCYQPDLCLLQISTRDRVFIVDPKGVDDISAVWQALVDPSKTVIVHAGREEILFAHRATSQPMQGLFDVQVAVGLLGGEYPASYGKLLQRILNENVPKGETRTDWRKRPLTRAQLDYAALDVLHLPQLYDHLTEQLKQSGRLTWLLDEVQRRQSNLLKTQLQESWIRLPGIQSMHGKHLAIARELWKWREERAQSRDMPARRVLRDDLIVEVAKRASNDPKRISHIRGLHHSGFQRFLPEIAACVTRGLKAPVPDAPWSQQNKRARPPALLQQFLTASMSYLCRTHNIAPAIVGTSDDVGKLASYWVQGRMLDESDDDFPHLLRGWRADLVGEPLHGIFTGEKGLRVVDPKNEMPLALCDIND